MFEGTTDFRPSNFKLMPVRFCLTLKPIICCEISYGAPELLQQPR
jgi:hypothetical protein